MSSSSPPSSMHDPMQESFYAPPAFDMSSSFQMNPLSAHPPRTPRQSSAAHFRNMSMSISVYDEKAEDQDTETVKGENPEVDEDGVEELGEEDARVKEAEKLVKTHEVWRDLFVTSNGRDKAFVSDDFFARQVTAVTSEVEINAILDTCVSALSQEDTISWWKLSLAAGNCPKTFGRKERILFHQVRTVSTLIHLLTTDGANRKMLIMFNWLNPLSQVLAQQSVPFSSSGSSLTPHSITAAPAPSSKLSQSYAGPFLSHPFLRSLLSAPPPVLLELVNGLSDDVYALSRLGLIGPKLGERASRFANWCWLLSTLVGLVENGVEMGVIEGLQREGARHYHFYKSSAHFFQLIQGHTKNRSQGLLLSHNQRSQRLTNVS